MRVGTRFAAPFGVSNTSLKRDLAGAVARQFTNATVTSHYLGAVFVAVGSHSK